MILDRKLHETVHVQSSPHIRQIDRNLNRGEKSIIHPFSRPAVVTMMLPLYLPTSHLTHPSQSPIHFYHYLGQIVGILRTARNRVNYSTNNEPLYASQLSAARKTDRQIDRQIDVTISQKKSCRPVQLDTYTTSMEDLKSRKTRPDHSVNSQRYLSAVNCRRRQRQTKQIAQLGSVCPGPTII